MKDVHDTGMGSVSQHRHCFFKFETWSIYTEDTVLLRVGLELYLQPAKIGIVTLWGFPKIVFNIRTKESFPKLEFQVGKSLKLAELKNKSYVWLD